MLDALIISPNILNGQRRDQHLADLTRLCGERDVSIHAVHFVRNNLQELSQIFRLARQRQRPFISFGGLGITAEDKTRQAVAQAFEVGLQHHVGADKKLAERFGSRYQAHHREWVNFPAGAKIIPNPVNYLPAFYLENIYCVPDVPEVARVMVSLILDQRFGASRPDKAQATILIQADEIAVLPLVQRLEALFGRLRLTLSPQLNQQLELNILGEMKLVMMAMNTMKVMLASQHLPFKTSSIQNNAFQIPNK